MGKSLALKTKTSVNSAALRNSNYAYSAVMQNKTSAKFTAKPNQDSIQPCRNSKAFSNKGGSFFSYVQTKKIPGKIFGNFMELSFNKLF